jgi:DNA-binding response OmpR family regulator
MNSLQATSVLLLEDEILIAIDIEELLREEGFQDISVMYTGADAEAWLQVHTPAIAIVDPHLKDGMCTGVARTLFERKVPFIVFSGVQFDGTLEASDFRKGQWVAKPASPEALIAALKAGLDLGEA